MPPNNAAAPAREQEPPSMMYKIAQGVGIFLLTQFLFSNFLGGKKSTNNGYPPGYNTVGNYEDRPAIDTISNYSNIPHLVAPIWGPNASLDIRTYVSPQLILPPLAKMPSESLVISEDNFVMGNYSYSREFQTYITIPIEVQNNGSLYAHIFAGLHGSELDPSKPGFDHSKSTHYVRQLNHYFPHKRVRKTKNLLDKNEVVEEEEEKPNGPPLITSHYHPNVSLVVVPDAGLINWNSMHPGMRKNVLLESSGARDSTGQNSWYYPVFYLNTFWQLRTHMTELNNSMPVTKLPLNINLYNMANWKYSILVSMDEGIKQQSTNSAFGLTSDNPLQQGAGDGSEFEKFKEILLDSNSYLLATTFVVSILHMIFEALAFKNDISHWKNKKDNIGTSVRTILANVFMQTVIFLYLVDNSDGTSWMILASQGFGILVEAWKITKAVNVVVRPPAPGTTFAKIGLPYVVKFEDKHKLSELEEKTEEYDKEAFFYLYCVGAPLLVAYAIYSLIYESHKSWYSYIIETLVGSVYAYGFLMMVPSLWLNYRLKSVAHMPGRAMIYKTLGTFIDDLFAFTIRMPILHRLATFRDDIIFFIYLYQKWIYRTDYSRVNEFGQGGEDEAAADKKDAVAEVQKVADTDSKELHTTAPIASADGKASTTGAEKANKSARKRK